MAVSSLRKFAGLGLLTTTMLCGSGMAFAQGTPAPGTATGQADTDTDIVVTATRRAENLQDVPIAITALGTQTLDELQVDDFDDYARFVPSLSYRSLGPGSANVYFRGVASGENANHSASLPSVGTYLDEQPITTTTGALDLHIYDIARVEALAGPQGTLYGASSQAGTVRIITNQPDTNSFYGALNAELNNVAHGDFGGTLEGFVNAPLSDSVALRVVAWYRHDAGYIDNIPGSLTFPTSGITMNNDRSGRRKLQRRRHLRRPRRPPHRAERPLDHHAERHGAAPGLARLVHAGAGSRPACRSRSSIPSGSTTAGTRRR